MKIETSVVIFILLAIVAFFIAIWLMVVFTKRLAKVFHGEKRPLKAAKLIDMLTLLVILCLFDGCVASFCSEFVTVAKNYSDEATIGVVSYLGFPIWFTRAADGLGFSGRFNPERFNANWCVWATIFLLICCSLYFMKTKRRLALLLGLILGMGCAGIVTFLLLTEANAILPIRPQIAEIAKAVQVYATMHKGKLPDSLDELIQSTDGEPPLLKKQNLIDPWGKPIDYERTEHGFIIRSSGPDRIMGTEDDYTN